MEPIAFYLDRSRIKNNLILALIPVFFLFGITIAASVTTLAGFIYGSLFSKPISLAECFLFLIITILLFAFTVFAVKRVMASISLFKIKGHLLLVDAHGIEYLDGQKKVRLPWNNIAHIKWLYTRHKGWGSSRKTAIALHIANTKIAEKNYLIIGDLFTVSLETIYTVLHEYREKFNTQNNDYL